MHDPDVVQGLIEELTTTLQRARDERFRMLRLLKDAEARQMDVAPPSAAPTAQTRQLFEKITAVDAAVTRRLSQLRDAEQQFDERFSQLQGLEGSVRDLAAKLTQEVRQARDLDVDSDVAEAGQRIEREAATIYERFRDDLRTQCDAICGEVAQTVDQMQDIEQALVNRQAEAQSLVQQSAEVLGQRVTRAIDEFDRQARQRLEPVRTELHSVLTQARREADSLVESLAARLDSELVDRLDQHRDAFAAREAQLCRELEKRFTDYTAQLREQLDREHARVVDAATARLTASIEPRVAELESACEARTDDLIRSMQQRIDACFDQVSCEADNAAVKLRQMFTDVRKQGDEDAAALVADMTRQIESSIEAQRAVIAKSIREMRTPGIRVSSAAEDHAADAIVDQEQLRHTLDQLARRLGCRVLPESNPAPVGHAA